MRAIDDLKARLEGRSDVSVEVKDDWLTVRCPAARGYEVSFWEADDEWVVFYEGWHEHFDSPEKAVQCFWDGLTGDYRIKVFKRGGKAYRWTLEIKSDGRWVSNGTTITASRLWKKRTIEYLANPWRPADGGADSSGTKDDS